MSKLIHMKETRLWDEANERFITVPETSFRVEHSLVSISKWESIWHKQFLNKQHNAKELLSYIECMCITQNVPSYIFYCMPSETIKEITDYMTDPMSATVITRVGNRKGGQGPGLTSEVMYYYMFMFNIPKECEKWHINRLIKLIEVFDEMQQPQKKMSAQDTARLYSKINAQRRAALHSKG